MSFPSPADDYLEPRLQLDSLIIHPAATFFFRMKGVAMEPTIHAGDVLIVPSYALRHVRVPLLVANARSDRALVALDGRAVVVIFQQQFLVRRVLIEDDKITLKADNPAFVIEIHYATSPLCLACG
jgi:DNA polymerase V